MKPIEIHIEGYKIVIEEDKKPEVTKDDDKITYIPYPVTPTYPTTTPYTPQPSDWWTKPYVTWTCDDTLSNINSTSTYETPIRDFMVGKATGGTVKGEPHKVGEDYSKVEVNVPKESAEKISELFGDALKKTMKKENYVIGGR